MVNNKLICGTDRYELIGDEGKEVISLPVSFDNLPAEIKVQEETFYLPSPFHASLFYIGKIKEIYNVAIPDFKNKIIDDFCEFTKTNEIKITRFNEFRLVDKKREKKTIVAMCKVSNLNKFFDFINEKYELSIKYPVPHVTLYNTAKGESGMYLMDSEDIKNFTILIENPLGFSL